LKAGGLALTQGTVRSFLASVVIDAIYEDGELIGFAKITRDITEWSKSAEALKERRTAFSPTRKRASPTMRFTCSTPTGSSATGTPAGSASRATSPRRSSASTFRGFYSPADQAAGPAGGARLAARPGRMAVTKKKAWRVRKDGSFFWASVIIDPIRDDDNKLLGFCQDQHAIFPSVEKPS